MKQTNERIFLLWCHKHCNKIEHEKDKSYSSFLLHYALGVVRGENQPSMMTLQSKKAPTGGESRYRMAKDFQPLYMTMEKQPELRLFRPLNNNKKELRLRLL